jgi:four helix bundle protein
MKSFEELDCWKKAASLRRRVSALVKTFPAEEKYRLVDQMIRASRSATAQIAEGFGRFHFQENIQFCRQARGSFFELIDHLITSNEEKLISDETLSEMRFEIDNCLAVLNGYINYLAKAKASSKVGEPREVYAQLTDND